jgi:hypothetical protein
MIQSKDRSYYFGASDTDKIIGKQGSDSWLKWWMQKLGINNDRFDNQYTLAGTHFEHRILESLGVIDMEYDKQIILEDLRLRVNLDGNTNDCIYECKTCKADKPFVLPKKYVNQVQVQMFASGLRQAVIVVYPLTEEDYINYFKPIDKERIMQFPIAYDEKWIHEKYLPRLSELSDALKRGVMPYGV